MIKQIEQIKQIATELGVIFEDDTGSMHCSIKIPSAYYDTKGDYFEDPSTIYIFHYDKKRITECLCYNNLTIKKNKFVWVGGNDYDSFIITIDIEKIKTTLIKCLKEIKDKEEELKIKDLEKDFK